MTTSSDIKTYFSSVPINRFLGFELEVCDKERCFLTMPVREDFRQEGGVVQGGIVAAFADTASAYALVPGLGENETMTGVEFKVNFLESASIEGDRLEASATVLRRGRRLGVCEVRVVQGGRTVLTGLFTYLFGKRKASSVVRGQ